MHLPLSVDAIAMSNAPTARLFRLGKAQAVRIPARFRLDADAVEVSMREDGALILRPKPRTAGEVFAQVRARGTDWSQFERPAQGESEAVEALEQ